MAQKTIIRLTDDVDGSEATETVSFGLDGTTYEIDLNDEHAADLREVLAPYVSVARRAGGGGRAVRGGAPSPRQRPSGDVDPKAVRAWAESNGIAVSPRGRIRADVVERYNAARK